MLHNALLGVYRGFQDFCGVAAFRNGFVAFRNEGFRVEVGSWTSVEASRVLDVSRSTTASLKPDKRAQLFNILHHLLKSPINRISIHGGA